MQPQQINMILVHQTKSNIATQSAIAALTLMDELTAETAGAITMTLVLFTVIEKINLVLLAHHESRRTIMLHLDVSKSLQSLKGFPATFAAPRTLKIIYYHLATSWPFIWTMDPHCVR